MIDRETLDKIRDDGFARARAWLDGKEEREKRERLRDTFAAAALTGLLSNIQRYQNGPLTQQAFEIADFMLKERDNTSVCKSGSDPVADRNSVAASGVRTSCCQPFDSVHTTHDAQPEAKAEPSERGTRREGQGTGDICERLRRWFKDVNAVPAIDLMDEAAGEIERLKEAIRRLADPT